MKTGTLIGLVLLLILGFVLGYKVGSSAKENNLIDQIEAIELEKIKVDSLLSVQTDIIQDNQAKLSKYQSQIKEYKSNLKQIHNEGINKINAVDDASAIDKANALTRAARQFKPDTLKID